MRLALDVATLSFMSGVIFTILALLLWVLWYGHRAERATLYWATSYTFAVAAIGLVLGRGSIPDIFSIALANTLAIGCYCLCWWGNEQFFGRKPQISFCLVLLAGLMLVNIYYSVIEFDLRMRILVYTGSVAAMALVNAFSMVRSPEPGMRMLQVLVAASYLLLAGFNMVRFAATLNTEDGISIFDNVTVNVANFVLPAVCCCVAAFAWSLMVNQRLRRQLAEVVRLDFLTRLLNRTALDEMAEQEISRHRRHHQPLSVLMLDIDHLKRVNDSYGHKQGDAVLLDVVETVREHLRREDHFGRFGGDAFMVLLPGTPASGARLMAERICRSMSRRLIQLPQGGTTGVTLSVGVATLDEQSGMLDWEQLAIRVDAALHEAKRMGRNRVVAAAGDPAVTLSAIL